MTASSREIGAARPLHLTLGMSRFCLVLWLVCCLRPALAAPGDGTKPAKKPSIGGLGRTVRDWVADEVHQERAEKNRKANQKRARDNAAKKDAARKAYELPRMPLYLENIERSSPLVKHLSAALEYIVKTNANLEATRSKGYVPWFSLGQIAGPKGSGHLVLTADRRLLQVANVSGNWTLISPRAEDFIYSGMGRQAVRKALRTLAEQVMQHKSNMANGGVAWAVRAEGASPTPAAQTLPSSGKGRQQIEALLYQRERPTVTQLTKTLRDAYGEVPKENPFGTGGRLKARVEDIADMIAQLELAFPGATWAPIGRDAVLVGDVLDGFYRSIGQPDRVRRLDASRSSFPHYRDATPSTFEWDRPLHAGFLKSNGLDLENLDKAKPLVMIDVTGYTPTSQSTQLVRSVYRTWAASGRDPRQLFEKFNFVGIQDKDGPVRNEIAHAGKDIESVKSRLKAGTTSDGPQQILYLRGAKDLTYSTPWHGRFQRFTPYSDGTVRTASGEPKGMNERMHILSELYEVAALTSSESFRGRVQKAAERYGYTFPVGN